MNTTAVSKSVQTDHVIAYCATNLVQTWLHQLEKEIKSTITAEPRAMNGKKQQGCNTKS
jgi:hypothetical protein